MTQEEQVPGAIWISETFVNADERSCYGETEPYETYFDQDEVGRLFRDLQQEHGRCIGRMYRDLPDGGAMHVGWVFQKRRRYQDADETYLSETWVHCYTGPVEVRKTYHHLDLGGQP